MNPASACAASRPPCTLSLATCDTILPPCAAMSAVNTGMPACSAPASAGTIAFESHGAARIAATCCATKSSICDACFVGSISQATTTRSRPFAAASSRKSGFERLVERVRRGQQRDADDLACRRRRSVADCPQPAVQRSRPRHRQPRTAGRRRPSARDAALMFTGPPVRLPCGGRRRRHHQLVRIVRQVQRAGGSRHAALHSPRSPPECGPCRSPAAESQSCRPADRGA